MLETRFSHDIIGCLQVTAAESLDCTRAGDHDIPYVFGRRPRALAPFPLSTREFARLLIVRSRVRAGAWRADDEAVKGA